MHTMQRTISIERNKSRDPLDWNAYNRLPALRDHVHGLAIPEGIHHDIRRNRGRLRAGRNHMNIDFMAGYIAGAICGTIATVGLFIVIILAIFEMHKKAKAIGIELEDRK